MTSKMDRTHDVPPKHDDLDTSANVSISSASSNDSQGLNVYQKTTSKSGLSKISSKLRLEKKREKRWKKNKIGKEDFFNKTTEFRTWLVEKKSIQLDTLTTPKAKSMFKKFVKKWNGKRLDQKYYSGLGVYWAAASPGAYDHNTVPVLPEAKAKEKLKASSFTPLYEQDFSTFGKKEGKKALRELQRLEGGTPTRPEDHVYDVPTSACSSFVEGTHKGTYTQRTCTIKRAIKARPALSQLFQPPGEVRPSMLDSGEEPIYAKVTRQRPLSCVGRVQHPPGEPHIQCDSNSTDPSNGLKPVTMRQPTGLPPRPRTEYQDSHTSFGYMRKKTSTSSTDSDVSSCSSSTLSSMSSVSSGVRSLVSEAEYVAFGPTARSASRNSEYVTFQPKPPPRSSSIGSRSQELREVAKVVLAKVGLTPTKQAQEEEHPGEGLVSPPPPSPPPPVPDTSAGSLNVSGDLLPPPPEFATGGMAAFSPALPPPPSPLVDAVEESAKGSSSQALPPQTPVAAPIRHAEMYFPTPPLPPPPSPTPLVHPPPGPTGQDPLLQQVTPLPPAATRRRQMTPYHGPTPGPVRSLNGQPALNVKTQKRPSGEGVEANCEATPAKKLDLDISYRSSYV